MNRPTLKSLDSNFVCVQTKDRLRLGVLRSIMVPTIQDPTECFILYDLVDGRLEPIESIDSTQPIVANWGNLDQSMEEDGFQVWRSTLSAAEQQMLPFLLFKAFCVQSNESVQDLILKQKASQNIVLEPKLSRNLWVTWAIRESERTAKECGARKILARRISECITNQK